MFSFTPNSKPRFTIAQLTAAAEKGDKKAQIKLGRCYMKGEGTEKNDKLAFKYFK